VEKTTLYLPEDLTAAVKQTAARQRVSEAEVIRQAIREAVGRERPRPRGALISTGRPTARQADELLTGFGDR
jgi:predicted transcriptional regulator